MNSFESRIHSKVEGHTQAQVVDILLKDFPDELQERLEEEIEDMDDQTAADYLTHKLIERKQALSEWGARTLPEEVQVSHELPLAIMESLEKSVAEVGGPALGEGQNGKVYQSLRQPQACYKVLFLERANQLGANIVREAVMQYEIGKVIRESGADVNVPQVFCFVSHPQVRAVMMEKVEGVSLLDVLEGRVADGFPPGFEVQTFFKKLAAAVEAMNEHGYFHRDLTNNAGNVMIDKEGKPWIIDFGSAIRSVSTDTEEAFRTYQLTANGPKIIGNDLAGIENLKQRVLRYLRTGKE